MQTVLYEGDYKTSLSALQELAHKDKNLFHRVIDAIKRFIERLKGPKQTRKLIADLERLEAKLQKAYESAEINRSTEDGGKKWSIINLDNGMSYIQASRRIITGNDVAVWRKQITEFFNRSLKNGPIKVETIDGDVLTISKETANKARDIHISENGTTRKLSNNEFLVKLHAEAHIDELAEISKKLPKSESDKKNHSFAKDGFTYRTVFFQDFDGSYYRVTISIGENNGVSTVYNVGKIKADNIPNGNIVSAIGSKADMLSTKNSIRQNTEKSQEKISERDSEYLELAKEPEKNEKIPNLWGLIDAIKKEQTENEFLSDLSEIREAHAQGEYHHQSVSNIISTPETKSQEKVSELVLVKSA